jgi:hypothetical protein
MSCPFAPGDGQADADSTCTDNVLESLDLWQANFSSDAPFFLAAGYQSPRLPWSYPAAVAARYPAAAEIPIASPALLGSPDDSLNLEWFRPTEIDWCRRPYPPPPSPPRPLPIGNACLFTLVHN